MAVVVGQLVEQSLPIPKVRGSNAVIGKKLYCIFTVNFSEKTKIKKKRVRMAHLKKQMAASALMVLSLTKVIFSKRNETLLLK